MPDVFIFSEHQSDSRIIQKVLVIRIIRLYPFFGLRINGFQALSRNYTFLTEKKKKGRYYGKKQKQK